MLKQRNNCQMCIKTTSARQDRKNLFCGAREEAACHIHEQRETRHLWVCSGHSEAESSRSGQPGNPSPALRLLPPCPLMCPSAPWHVISAAYLGHHLWNGDNNTSCLHGCKRLPTKIISFFVYQLYVVHGLSLVYRSWSLIIIILIVMINSNYPIRIFALVLFLSELLSWGHGSQKDRAVLPICGGAAGNLWLHTGCTWEGGTDIIHTHAMNIKTFRHWPHLTIQNCHLLCTACLQSDQEIYCMWSSAK